MRDVLFKLTLFFHFADLKNRFAATKGVYPAEDLGFYCMPTCLRANFLNKIKTQ